MKKYFLAGWLFFNSLSIFAQQENANFPFSIRLAPMEINGFEGLQSFVIGKTDPYYILIGGRTDGLHLKQPWATFNKKDQNKSIYAIDPIQKTVYKRSIAELSNSIQEQLQSTNMEFVQVQDQLICIGGYGYSASSDDHITFPYLLSIDTKGLAQALSQQQPIASFFQQIKDERMAVTGGQLGKIGEKYYLVGGQRFDGRYNPHGPDHGPGFTQQYTNEIRSFELNFQNPILEISNYKSQYDSLNLHRRDYNLVPQIFNANSLGYTAFSGVFQYDKDLPFTNFVDIFKDTYKVSENFEQKLNHYHSAVIPIFSKKSNTMFTIFLGGIAQYYVGKNNKIIEDENVPFTKTISVITRQNNNTEETFLPLQMPGYLGASAVFIPTKNVQLLFDEIIDSDAIQQKEILAGYIIGGINSSDKNIFWENTGKQSSANAVIYQVWMKEK
ncbi:MAG: hypothetical protein ACOYKE_02115 [Ferruginibacter sp.]